MTDSGDDRSGRGALRNSGRFIPLRKPPTLAPPIHGAEESSDYEEVSVEPSIPDGPAEEITSERAGAAPEPVHAAQPAPPRRRWWQLKA